MGTNQISILLLKDGSQWTAQCLEYDIAAQGQTIRQAVFEFQRTLVAEAAICATNGDESLESIDPAPEYYWKLFESAGEPLRDDPTPRFRFPDMLPPGLMPPTSRQLRVA